MYKTDPLLIEQCRTLRKKGFTLGEIIKAVQLPKTTVYDHIRDIPLPSEIKRQIQEERIRKIKEKRKGKCLFGRVIPKPKVWSDKLIFLIAHFMFDGEIQSHSCIYHNRNKSLIKRVKDRMQGIFNLTPHELFNKETGVYRISYHYVELADYMRSRARKLKRYIKTAPFPEKRIFLKVFFDDEGCVGRWGRKKLVRGFQHDLEILKLIRELLKDFDIDSRIDEKYKEIVISRKENLIKFRDKINFSKGIFINPNRKNSIWKKKLEKREILNRIIDSYKR